MGFFSNVSTESDEKRAERLRHELKGDVSTRSKRLSEAIANYDETSRKTVIRPFSLFLDVVEAVMRNPDFEREHGKESVVYGEEIYPHVFYMGEKTPDFDRLRDFFVELFDTDGVVTKRIFIPALYHRFYDPMNFLRLSRLLPGIRGISVDNKHFLIDLAGKISGFCADEEMFTMAMATYASRVLLKAEPAKVVMEEVERDFRHLAGIYEVSEERIAAAEQKINTVELVTQRLVDTLALSEERIKAAGEISESAIGTIKEFGDAEILRVTSRVNALKETMQKVQEDFMETQKRSVLAERDELVNSMISESRNRVEALRREADGISAGLREEIIRSGKEASSVIARTESFFRDDSRIREAVSGSEEARELREKIDRLMLLDEGRLRGAASETIPENGNILRANAVVVRSAEPADGMQPDAPLAEEKLPPVSPLLNPEIPFSERYAKAIEAKNAMASQGVLFHKMFDDVLTAVMENSNPYLIGPSGCGKTFMVNQIASILNLEHIDIGYINEEYDILGFQTANGGYSRPNFYRCYKYGKIAFCDELDNGNSRATVKLNSFLSNTENACYSFPNGENVPRHPNFRIVAAGNTVGNGADANYNSREKIEESVQQRFTPIYVGYDNRMEEAIMRDYPEWFRFVVAFRQATDAWAQYTHAGASGIITTRDASKICRYLDNGSFSAKKIIEYEFIQTKDAEYLEFLDRNLREQMGKMSKPCAEIFMLFHTRAQEIITGKDTIRTV
ncbi:MAG: AAA family ATPase [Lachnospiraceae bacterium]|nr:AAA family ATPase [Lachnospiraceae bacterium]